MRNRKTALMFGMVLAVAVLVAGVAVSIAIAQSGGGAFNLNSPASFPVDI